MEWRFGSTPEWLMLHDRSRRQRRYADPRM